MVPAATPPATSKCPTISDAGAAASIRPGCRVEIAATTAGPGRVSLTRERIEGLAPDQASLAAAFKLVKPASWPVLAATADAAVLWGECQGSGATPYRVVVSPDDSGYKCTCPSRKFPCKHVLAVMWLRLDKPERFETAAEPQWVSEWSARRRTGSRPRAAANGGGTAASLDTALAAGAAAPVDPAAAAKAAARAQAQRQRLRAEREAAVAAGLDDLDRWVVDQLSQGLAGFPSRCEAAVRPLSTRLVDAKAGGLAARLDNLAAELFRVPQAERADLAVERLAALTLIAAAYRRQDRLPPPLREDVRRAAGWAVRREDLIADAAAPRLTATWIVAANRSEVQPDRLVRLETWLVRAGGDGAGDDDDDVNAPRVAVLIDFVPVVSGGRPGFAFAAGEAVTGEVVFHPSAAPLRGVLASRTPAAEAPWPRSPRGLAPALAAFARRLGALPWLDRWPLAVDGVALRPAGPGLALVDADGAGDGVALPLARGQREALLPLLGLPEISVVCLWDGHAAEVLAADTPIGRWHGE